MELNLLRGAGQRLSDQPPDPPHTLPQATQELQEAVPNPGERMARGRLFVYPNMINEFKIENADVTYVDQDAS